MLQEEVAIKIMKNKKRFYQQALIEVKILEGIKTSNPANNKNIVKLREKFMFRNHLCLTFELLSVNLYDYLKMN